MAIPKFLEDLLIISKLGDNPGVDNGLSSSGLREKFDEAGVKIQEYINDTLIPAISGLSNPSDHNIPANGSITIRFNSQRHVALIAVQGSHMNNRSVFVVNTYGNGGVRTHIKRLCGEDAILYGILPESADDTNGIVLFNQSTDGYVSASILILFGAYPEVTNGNSGVTAEPFEWDNPPMIPGVEYRTTERCEGKPVYAKRISFTPTSGIAADSEFSIHHGISNFDKLLRCYGNANQYPIPYFGSDGSHTGVAYCTSAVLVMATHGTGWGTNYTFHFNLFYTKTT